MMDGKKSGVAKKSYDGNAVQAWHDVHDIMIDIAFPAERCTPGSTFLENKAKALDTWSKYLDFWNFVRAPLDYGCPLLNVSPDDLKSTREAAALQAETLG